MQLNQGPQKKKINQVTKKGKGVKKWKEEGRPRQYETQLKKVVSVRCSSWGKLTRGRQTQIGGGKKASQETQVERGVDPVVRRSENEP